MKIAVIGAGPAGLTAAHQLAQKGHQVEVFEASSQLGGMARSFNLWGTRVDLGPHRFFSADSRVNSLWHELVGPDFRMVDRMTRIFYRGGFFDYPLRPVNVLARLGGVEAARCMLSYGKQLISSKFQADTPASFEDWVVASFGRRLFEVFGSRWLAPAGPRSGWRKWFTRPWFIVSHIRSKEQASSMNAWQTASANGAAQSTSTPRLLA